MGTNQQTAAGKRLTAILLLTATAALWSLGGLLIKSVGAHPLAIAGTRSAIATLVILLARGRRPFRFSRMQILAALAYAGTVMLFVAANKNTTAANAILLQYTAPVYVILLGAWLLGERARYYDWLCVLVVLGGMALFFVDKLSTSGMLGNILSIASGMTFALFTVFMRKQKDGFPLDSVLLGNVLTAVIGLPFLSVGVPDGNGWLCLIVLGIVQLGIPYVLYSKAIMHATALEAILVPVLEPLLNPVWVLIFMGEQPGLWAIAGGAVVVLAVTVRCVVAVLDSRTGRNKTIVTTESGNSSAL